MLLFYPCNSFFFFLIYWYLTASSHSPSPPILQLIRNIRIADAGKKTLFFFCLGLKIIFVLFPIQIGDLNIAPPECSGSREGETLSVLRELWLVVQRKGWDTVWTFMCAWERLCLPRGVPLLAVCSAVKENNRQMMYCTEHQQTLTLPGGLNFTCLTTGQNVVDSKQQMFRLLLNWDDDTFFFR